MANIKHNLVIKSSTQNIYNAITTEEGLSNWWTNDTIAKPEIGFINQFQFGPEHCKKIKVVELDNSNKVTWELVEGDEQWIGTKIVFQLDEKNGNTFLKFSHLNWAEETEYFGVCNYHWGKFLDSLKSLCETGKGEPFK